MNLRRGLIGALLAAGLIAGSSTVAQAHPEAPCQQKRVPVSLAEGEPATYRVATWLCTPRRSSGIAQVVLHGATYGGDYWMWPGYSYTEAAMRAGHTVLVVDRLGVGESDYPPAELVTAQVQAYVAIQLVIKLRAGRFGRPYDRVVGVGHSVGAGLWMYAAGQLKVGKQPGRPDALVLSSFMHTVVPSVVAAVGAARWPASEDPKFANAGLPAGYYTTRPGTRGLFYSWLASPKVIARDERLKETIASGEISTLGVTRDPNISARIKVPVLLALGQRDALYCDEAMPGMSCRNSWTVRQRESSAYSDAARFDVYVAWGAGHSLNLHYNAQKWFSHANHWITRNTP